MKEVSLSRLPVIPSVVPGKTLQLLACHCHGDGLSRSWLAQAASSLLTVVHSPMQPSNLPPRVLRSAGRSGGQTSQGSRCSHVCLLVFVCVFLCLFVRGMLFCLVWLDVCFVNFFVCVCLFVSLFVLFLCVTLTRDEKRVREVTTTTARTQKLNNETTLT